MQQNPTAALPILLVTPNPPRARGETGVARADLPPRRAALDKGHDAEDIYAECIDHGCQPIIPLRETRAVKRGDHKPPTCDHGEWRFAGADYQRGAGKWRCPIASAPASRWDYSWSSHAAVLGRATKPRWLDVRVGLSHRPLGCDLRHEFTQ